MLLAHITVGRLRILSLVGYLLSFTLVSCGQSQITGSSTPGTPGATKAVATATPHIDLLNLLKLNPQMSEDVPDKVFVKLQGENYDVRFATEGFVSEAQAKGGINCGSAVVLSSPSLTYSSTQIQHIRSYFSDFVTPGDEHVPPYPPSNPNSVPSELHWVQGVPGATCIGEMEVTNESNAQMRIMGVGADLTQDPIANTFQYHLVEKCSVLGGCSIGQGHGGGPECLYYADILVGQGEKGTPYKGVITADSADQPCPTTIFLDKHQTVDIIIRFTPASEAKTGMIYQILPYLLLGSGSSTEKVSLANLKSTVVFSSHNQYGCYGLHGNTFALVKGIDLSKEFTQYTNTVSSGTVVTSCE